MVQKRKAATHLRIQWQYRERWHDDDFQSSENDLKRRDASYQSEDTTISTNELSLTFEEAEQMKLPVFTACEEAETTKDETINITSADDAQELLVDVDWLREAASANQNAAAVDEQPIDFSLPTRCRALIDIDCQKKQNREKRRNDGSFHMDSILSSNCFRKSKISYSSQFRSRVPVWGVDSLFRFNYNYKCKDKVKLTLVDDVRECDQSQEASPSRDLAIAEEGNIVVERHLQDAEVDYIINPATGKRVRTSYKNTTRKRRIEANARERSRVHTIGAAFERLRRLIPTFASDNKLSKLSILRITSRYILLLAAMNDLNYSDNRCGYSVSECIDLLLETVSKECRGRERSAASDLHQQIDESIHKLNSLIA